MSHILKLESVNFGYSKSPLHKNISFSVKKGEIACVIGPSGCGKSALLRLIAGFESVNSGKIFINNKEVSSAEVNVNPQQRNVGMLFQDLALFPHMTVLENIKYGMNVSNPNRVNELLDLCRISDLSKRYPHELSGGQKQRVALARAMAPKPQIILLDEPFSSLDQDLKNELVHEVKSLLKKDNSTALWVTHSLEEACGVADQVGLILDGKLQQWSSPDKLINHPENIPVINFTNQSSLLSGILNNQKIETAIGTFDLTNSDQFKGDSKIQIAINHDQILVEKISKHNAIVQLSVYKGSHYLVTLKLIDSHEVIQAKLNHDFKVKDKVYVSTIKNGFYGYQ
ncbi:MAG: ABC transporter ATP-binding protein [Marinicellaceae bacterium]